MTKSLSNKQVADYLLEHPDFFEEHVDLLSYLSVPHPSGEAISLVERQIDLLRQQNRKLESKLTELVTIARDNQRVTDHLHTLAKALVESASLQEVIATTEDTLRQQFGIKFVTLHLFEGLAQNIGSIISNNHHNAHFSELMNKNRPQCGLLSKPQKDCLFGNQAEQVKSSAMIPLSNVHHIGVLALGSDDAERFHPLMGTFFLEQLGALLSSSIERHLS